jgi:hypothetical protein
MKKISSVWLIGLSILLIFGLAEGQKIKTVDGVRTVSNGKKPYRVEGQPSKIALTEELTVGGGTDPDKSFSQVGTFVVDNEGTIFALDSKEQKIKVFDRMGKYVRTIGKPGQGPGELGTMASGIQLTADNTLLVEDAANRRLAQFKRTGEFIKNISTVGRLALVNLLLDSKGNFLGRELGTVEGNAKVFFEIKKFDPDLKPLFTLDKTEFSFPVPGSGTKINFLDLASAYQFDPSGNIYYGRNANYDIKIYNPEGKHIRTIQKEYDSVKVTQKDIDEMLERIPNVAGGVNIKDIFAFPDVFPPFQYFILDDQGRIFVRTYTKGKAKGEYVIDVFDPEGRFIAQFITKTDLRLIKAGKAYGIEESDEGYQTIKRYAVSTD